MEIKPFRAIRPKLEFISSPETFFGTVKYDYPEYFKNGFFAKDAQEAIYIYQIKRDKIVHTGILACADIQDYINGSIKKHENTLAAKEQSQIQLLLARKSLVKPVLLTYKGVSKIDQLIKEEVSDRNPDYSIVFEEKKLSHHFWMVANGQKIGAFQELFKQKIKTAYIADGHHRCATIARMYNQNKDNHPYNGYKKLFCSFFSMEQLEIHDFNRVVEGLAHISLTKLMAYLSNVFQIEVLDESAKPSKKHEIILFVNNEWFKLTWKKEVLNEYKNEPVVLDATLLDEKVLRDIINIVDIRTDERLKYVEGPKGLSGLQKVTAKNDLRMAFILYPVAMKDFIHVATHNAIMPPKSTWFEPRMMNGLINKAYEV